MSFSTFLSHIYIKDLKMAIIGLKVAILDYKMAMELSENFSSE